MFKKRRPRNFPGGPGAKTLMLPEQGASSLVPG